jgi:hypothetical protein
LDGSEFDFDSALEILMACMAGRMERNVLFSIWSKSDKAAGVDISEVFGLPGLSVLFLGNGTLSA